MKTYFGAVLALVALAVSSPGAVGKRRQTDGSGVYVFEPQLVLDMNRYQFSMLPGNVASIQDCSDKNFFCIASGAGSGRRFFSVTVPKKCLDPVLNQTWTTGPVKTRVIAMAREPIGPEGKIQGATSYFLADTKENSVVYLYRPTSGIVAVILGGRNEDIVTQFSIQKYASNGFEGKVHEIVTFDRLAGCNGR